MIGSEMNTQNENTPTNPWLNILEIVITWKKFIFINIVIVGILTSGITLLMPNYYKSTASILPPKQQDIFGTAVGASSLLRGLSGGSRLLGNLGKSSGTYNYLAILKSRTSMEAVIEKFGLMDVYEFKENERDKAIKTLEENTFFEVQDDENITIEVYDRDPQRAADMANYFVSLLNSTSIRLGTQEAKNNREFIERRLLQCRNDLRNAEDSLRMFQEKTEIFISEDVKSSSVSAYAELYALKAKKEIEIGVLEKTVSPDNQLLHQLKSELTEISKKVKSFPEAGLDGLRLYREVLIQSKLLEFLLPIYEQAKIDEQKDVPVLLVIDDAKAANKKAKPKRATIVIVVVFLFSALFLLVSVIFHAVLKNDYPKEYMQKIIVWIRRIMKIYRINIKIPHE
ncbi:MAG: Wzz/FepE/Etk N-terminal domain-containing protein [Bacteroidota bacterium]